MIKSSLDKRYFRIHDHPNQTISCYGMKYSIVCCQQEANNLKNRHSQRYNGIINTKTVGVTPCADGKGVVLTLKNHKSKSCLQL